MEHYIDKTKVMAEIERLQDTTIENGHFRSTYFEGVFDGLSSIERFMDTLEAKEEDLEREIELVKGDYEQVDVAWNNDFDFIARHFYELGLQARKGGES